MSDLLDTLTSEQRAAACSDLTSTVVSAAAGSGKTQLLAARIAYLLGRAEPEQILCLVFTRAAAEAIRARLRQVSGETAEGVRVATFHGYAAARVLPAISGGCRVATESESDAVLRSLVDGSTRLPSFKNPGIRNLERAVASHEAGAPVTTQEGAAVQAAVRRLAWAGLIPTWDLLAAYEGLHVEAAALHVLVDEAQDTTPREVRFASTLGGLSTTWVGDPRQAIMGFRGGSSACLSAPTHGLTHSFRFGQAIADLANKVAARFRGAPITGSHAGGLVEHAGAAFDIGEKRSGSTAVLCRTNYECEQLAQRHGLHRVVRDPLGEYVEDPFAAPWAEGRPTVSTVHAMKGREADTVILAFDPLNPRERDPEAQRVAYVAATRAHSKLIVAPQEFQWR